MKWFSVGHFEKLFILFLLFSPPLLPTTLYTGSSVVSAATIHSVSVGAGASGSVTSNDHSGYHDNVCHFHVHYLLLLPLLFGEKYSGVLVAWVSRLQW